ncbi:uncharacterized protein isoform X2 [Danio rerio]|uniref:Uncharacterized protein isoform X2 n=5 Tax=Danio rerio TaxID=7955 RepID=A0AC58IMV3_DANRE|nr:formin-J-like [Danio rerio]|eukprot:XP_005170655.1 formin-J-like [Danio rerio]
MSGVSLTNESWGFDKEGGAFVLTAPPPAPPPPPPLPAVHSAERKRRVKSFFWKPIPEDRVRQQDRTNLWSLRQDSREQTLHIDITAIQELFGHPQETPTLRPAPVRDRRQQVSLLDSKRSLNISIFLKHFKKSPECLLDAVLQGNTGVFTAESLKELLKLLPEEDEVKNLQMFSGDLKDLAPPDAFIHQLINLPRYEDLLQALLLKEEFFPSITVMKDELSVILSAINELLNCEELHTVLHLVLQAGNVMNAGGSAGNAVGFRLSSLLSLADTKANKPGMNLLHFVALEAEKKDLLLFPDKLLHVQRAARVCVDSIHTDFNSLSRRVLQLQQILHTDEELQSFLKSAAEALQDLSVSIDELQRESDALLDFFCEDKDSFKLDECLRIFQNFCSKFRKAVQENVERGMWEESRRRRLRESEDKRHSWAGHEGAGGAYELRSSSEADVEAALKREGLLELLHSPLLRPRNNQRSKQQKIVNTHELPPIHALSITDTQVQNETNAQTQASECESSTKTEEVVDHQEVLSISPNTDLQTTEHTEVTPNMLSIDDQNKKINTSEPLINIKETQTTCKPPAASKNRVSLSAKSSLSRKSETANVRKVVPLRQSGSAAQNNRNDPQRKQSARSSPVEKICRLTMLGAAQNVRDSTIKPQNFARNTIASATRIGKQSSIPNASPLMRTTSLRLSQDNKKQEMTTGSDCLMPPAGQHRKSRKANDSRNQSSAQKVFPLTRTASFKLSQVNKQQETTTGSDYPMPPSGHQLNSSNTVDSRKQSSVPKASPLMRTTSLRLSQDNKQQKTAAGSVHLTPPAGQKRKSRNANDSGKQPSAYNVPLFMRTTSVRLSQDNKQQETAGGSVHLTPPAGQQRKSANSVDSVNYSSAYKLSPLTRTASLRNTLDSGNQSSAPKVTSRMRTTSLRLLQDNKQQEATARGDHLMPPGGHQRKSRITVDSGNQSSAHKVSSLVRAASLSLSNRHQETAAASGHLKPPAGQQRKSRNTVGSGNQSSAPKMS